VPGRDKERDHEVRHGVGSSRPSRSGCGGGNRVRHHRRYDVYFGDVGLGGEDVDGGGFGLRSALQVEVGEDFVHEKRGFVL
jgi:hypothetical protein